MATGPHIRSSQGLNLPWAVARERSQMRPIVTSVSERRFLYDLLK